ncbi:PilN domain-containing protein [Vibrio methylphosphonaticus]|uniref:PilN domain-containing protein n=1 Tax=Vibrio methylphosphonaticus TaxID=2946866 RepID=UPI00202A30E5|nr:PilN domain-containing protein [Vibrio methylphosphonaticus]MCL9775579.1 PilN domain-containing protein [Vibrio methylphosphonaticus]
MEMVNLLPWREKKRHQHRQRFVVALIVAVAIAAAAVQAAMWYVSMQIETQQTRQRYLQQKVSDYQKDIASLAKVTQSHTALEQRLGYVETLQIQRNKTTLVMNALPTLVPNGVYVDKVRMEGTSFKLSGISSSTAKLAQMLERFETSGLLLNVDMHSIVHGNQRFGQRYQSFSISFQLDSGALTDKALEARMIDGEG